LIILVIVILVFGVGKLPEVGSSLGKAIRGFREETEVKPAEKKTEDNKEVKKD